MLRRSMNAWKVMQPSTNYQASKKGTEGLFFYSLRPLFPFFPFFPSVPFFHPFFQPATFSNL
jgi:hypothetical protein